MDNLEILKRNMVEVITDEEVEDLTLENAKAYIGFEPSGLPHIGTGILWPRKLNDLVDLGINVTVLLADWHAMVNDKFGGDLELIRKSGELLKRTMQSEGLSEKVKFVWARDLVASSDYWKLLLHVGKNANLARVRRALPIMGRTEEEADRDFSKYIYPLMQVTDIMYMDLDIALGGMDQRHAHMLARDIAEKMGRKKVISMHSPLLGSLLGAGRMDSFKKMSKSVPESAVFLTDSRESVDKKIQNAFCPIKETEGNPIIDIVKYVILPYGTKEFLIKRPQAKGGPITIEDYGAFERMYRAGEIHPADLKKAVADSLNHLIEPARKTYSEDALLREIIDDMKQPIA